MSDMFYTPDGVIPVEDLIALITGTDTGIPTGKLAAAIAEEWKRIYENPGYRVYLNGKDDPASLPVSGRHAFVVLGLMLKNGEMTEELIRRCETAAAAARVHPDSVIVCSGGATGENNPDRHTEAGLMKSYMEKECGIETGRIFTDEQALDTVENAVNTFRILKAQEIDTITIVTSSYHQRRANMLYFALAEFLRETEGYSIRIAGNYGPEADWPEGLGKYDAGLAVYQLGSMIRYLKDKEV